MVFVWSMICIHDAPEPKCPLALCLQEVGNTGLGGELAPGGAARGPDEPPVRQVKFPFSSAEVHGKSLRKVKCPGKVCRLLLAVAPSLPVSGRKCAAAPACKACAVRGASPRVWTNSWGDSAPRY